MPKQWRNKRKNKRRAAEAATAAQAENGGGGADGGDHATTGIESSKKDSNYRDSPASNPYKMVEHGNFKMEAFYAYQGIHNYCLKLPDIDDTTTTTNNTDFTIVECVTAEEKDEERKRWLSAMKSMLPASFRIGNDVDPPLRERLEHELDGLVGQKMEIEIEPKGGKVMIEKHNLKPEIKFIAPAKKIPYIPHGYQLSLDRATIRNNATLQPLHEWLKVQTEAGMITRQETVSMIPPVVLDPHPHHMILDMAAAPGSKTSQLLEIVNMPSIPGDTEPTGCVVANDSDVKRAYMLVHQVRRINSPAIFVSSCDARFFPMLRSDDPNEEGIFDRVLADVPCSGDGTARKNPGIWKNWNSLNGYALHPLQLAIALRGAQLTKVGGYLCYSTCSMNPIENEAVVAELLRSSEGSLELVERRSQLPGLMARNGLYTWKNLAEIKSNKEMKDYQNKNNEKMQARRKEWDEKRKKEKANSSSTTSTTTTTTTEEPNTVPVESGQDDDDTKDETTEENNSIAKVSIQTQFQPTSMDDQDELKRLVESVGMIECTSCDDVPDVLNKRIRPSCFPPSIEEAKKLKLEHCMRILPQDMDTGGFFVALLKKVAPFNAKARTRFEVLQEQLKNQDDTINQENALDDKPEAADGVDKAGNGDGGGSDHEPKVKKAKIEEGVSVKDDVDEGIADEQSKDDVDGGDEMDNGDNPTDRSRSGIAKKTFLKDKEGKRSKTVGRDDFLPCPEDIFAPLKEYYGLDDESFEAGQYMIRACGDKKVLYFMSKTVKSQLLDRGIQERVTVVTSGLKGFVRNNKDCDVDYRVAQEGVHFVAPHMKKRKIGANVQDFELCLSAPTVQLKDFSEEFAADVRTLTAGAFVVYLNGYEDDYIKKLAFVMWRCRSDAVNYLVTKTEIDGMKTKIRAIMSTSAQVTEDAAPTTETG
jgi:16S rRNA C967 or C1407 C5-methylase (RsmB/RsmF family)